MKTERSPSGKDDRLLCFQYKRGDFGQCEACDYWHHPHCRQFKSNQCKMGKGLSICSPTKGRSSLKFEWKHSFSSRISHRNRRSCKTAICTSDEKVIDSDNSDVTVYQKPQSEKTKVQFSRPPLEGAKFRDKRQTLNVV